VLIFARTFFSTLADGPSVRITGRNSPAHASTKLKTASDTGLQGLLGMGLSPMLPSASLIHQMLMDSCQHGGGYTVRQGTTSCSREIGKKDN